MPAANGGMQALWLAETLRLREVHWGPLEDESEVRRARAAGGDFSGRLLLRARLLGEREGLQEGLARWARLARSALLMLLVLALLAGVAAGTGALGDGARPVNLVLALGGLLGVHILSLLFWILSFAWAAPEGGAWLGRLWLWLTEKLARGPDAALIPRAFLQLMARAGALRWLLGGISHALWTGAFIGMLASLLLLLSARRYSFTWETTILSPEAYIGLTHVLGWLPAWLGFAVPSADIVRISDGLHTLPPGAQALWSEWLIGCILLYGLVPRVISLALSILIAVRRIRALRLDENLPGFGELRERLAPSTERIGIDAPPPDVGLVRPAAQRAATGAQARVLAGIELAPDLPWPPAALSPSVQDSGIIDSGAERRTLLETLDESPAQRLLLVCDARQTPDRGTIAFMLELARLSDQTRILLADLSPQATRRPSWEHALIEAGFTRLQLSLDAAQAVDWLHHDE